MSTTPERAKANHDEIHRKLAAIGHLREVKGFSDDLLAQTEAVILLWSIWTSPALITEVRDRTAASLIPLLYRCQNDPGGRTPEECFLEIMALQRGEEVRRAVKVRRELYEDFTPVGAEAVYPTTGWIGDYLYYCRQGSVPLGYHFWSAVTLMGAVCRRNLYFDGGQFEVRPNWYIILSGVKACGKSSAYTVAKDMIHRVNRITGAYDNPQLAHIKVNILPEEVTVPGIVSELSRIQSVQLDKNDSGIVYSTPIPVDATAILFLDELATFLGRGQHEVDRKAPFLVTLYNSDTYTKGTKGDGRETLREVGLSMLACCAPDWLRNTISQDMLGGGLMDRVHFIHRDPVWQRQEKFGPTRIPPLDPLAANQLAKRLVPLTATLGKNCAVITPEAESFVNSCYTKLVKEEKKSFHNPAKHSETTSSKRMTASVIRLSMMLAISRGSFPGVEIKLEDAEMAWRILEVEGHSLGVFLDIARKHRDAEWFDRLVGWVDDRGGCCSVTEISRRYRPQLGYNPVVLLKAMVEDKRLICIRLNRARYYRLPGHICERCEDGVEIK